MINQDINSLGYRITTWCRGWLIVLISKEQLSDTQDAIGLDIMKAFERAGVKPRWLQDAYMQISTRVIKHSNYSYNAVTVPQYVIDANRDTFDAIPLSTAVNRLTARVVPTLRGNLAREFERYGDLIYNNDIKPAYRAIARAYESMRIDDIDDDTLCGCYGTLLVRGFSNAFKDKTRSGKVSASIPTLEEVHKQVSKYVSRMANQL